MHLSINLLAFLCLFELVSSTAIIILPRDPKGGGGGGRGGGGGGGRSSGGSSGSSGSSGGRSITSSGTGRGGSGDTGRPSISNPSSSSRSANYFSQGGGKSFTVSQGTFKGREMGGGTRADVGTGTRGYASGYPYSQGDVRRTGVVGQPFPFGFWPVYWGGYGYSHQYGGNSTLDAERPGNKQVAVQLVPNDPVGEWSNTTIGKANQTLWMIGDSESVTTLLTILADTHTSLNYGCGVKNATTQPFNGTSTTAPIHFESVIQWYRASSFALAYEGYNNTFALAPHNETFNLGYNESTPLPPTVESSTFIQCINTTILASLPILDGEPEAQKLDSGAIAGIVIGSVVGALCLLVLVIILVKHVRKGQAKKKEGGGDIKYTPVEDATAPTTAAEKDTEPDSPPPPSFPLPVHYDPHTEKTAPMPSPDPAPSPPTSPGRGDNLAVPPTKRESNYSGHTLVEDVAHGYGYGHHRKTSSVNAK